MQILTLPKMPKSLVVIGSGAVGVEFASVFKSFGADVTVLEALPRAVPVEDEEVSKELTRQYKKRGIEVSTSCKVEKIEKTKGGAKVSWVNATGKPESKEVEKVLVAVGRAPRTYDAGLDKVNLQLDRGFVTVNEWMETSVPASCAKPTLSPRHTQLAHVGAMAGIVVASKLAGKYARAVRKDRVPGCTYCDPQIASVGLTEAQAERRDCKVEISKDSVVGNSRPRSSTRMMAS